jgi:hypothetical protein
LRREDEGWSAQSLTDNIHTSKEQTFGHHPDLLVLRGGSVVEGSFEGDGVIYSYLCLASLSVIKESNLLSRFSEAVLGC